jgi:hypothetical protein
MPAYYVRTDGSDSNSGLGPASNQAWRTLNFALGASGISSGDTLYVAPGDYRLASFLNMTKSYTSTVNIIGDTTAAQFVGLNTGRVLVTNRTADDSTNVTYSGGILSLTSSFCNFTNILFENASLNNINVAVGSGSSTCSFTRCQFMYSSVYVSSGANLTMPNEGLLKNYTFNQCLFTGKNLAQQVILPASIGTTAFDCNIYFNRCYFGGGDVDMQAGRFGFSGWARNLEFRNCWITGNVNVTGTKIEPKFYNCVILGNVFGGDGRPTTLYNCYSGNRSGITAVVNSYVGTYEPFEYGQTRLWGLDNRTFLTPATGSGGTAGTTDGISFDLFGNTWPNNLPQIGLFQNESNTILGPYNPTEKQQINGTFSPNDTSKSFNIYLGVAGLFNTTPGLAAFYTRQNGIGTTITLANQTPTGSWISGGFCAIDTVNQPGLYRLDVPNAAFISGASNVTIGVRSTSSVNGAYINCQALDIPNALLNTQAGIYTSAGTLGARLLQTVADNRPVIVTSANQIQVDAGQTFSSGSGTTILDPILNSVGRWTLEGSTLTLYNADGTYLRRCNLTQLGLSLSPT